MFPRVSRETLIAADEKRENEVPNELLTSAEEKRDNELLTSADESGDSKLPMSADDRRDNELLTSAYYERSPPLSETGVTIHTVADGHIEQRVRITSVESARIAADVRNAEEYSVDHNIRVHVEESQETQESKHLLRDSQLELHVVPSQLTAIRESTESTMSVENDHELREPSKTSKFQFGQAPSGLSGTPESTAMPVQVPFTPSHTHRDRDSTAQNRPNFSLPLRQPSTPSETRPSLSGRLLRRISRSDVTPGDRVLTVHGRRGFKLKLIVPQSAVSDDPVTPL